MNKVFYVIANKDLKMSPGKLAAQCGHAVAEMLFEDLQVREIVDYLDPEKSIISRVRYEKGFSKNVLDWRRNGQTKIVLEVSEDFLESIEHLEGGYPIRDSGRTEVKPESLTCIGFGPFDKDEIPDHLSFIKKLKLYGNQKSRITERENMKTNLKMIASLFDGKEYLEEISGVSVEDLKKNGYVVIYGYSDDNIILNGAINDSYGAYLGRRFSFSKEGLSNYDSTQGFLDAIWSKDGYSWLIKTDYPHETFTIMEGGENFCRGIVVHIDDLK